MSDFAGSLASHAQEAKLFRQLRVRQLKTLARTAWATTRVQIVSVLVASTIMWLGLFAAFYEGFQFIQDGLPHAGLRAQLVQAVFNIFFLALTIMLTFSSAIILYTALYRSDETDFLLSTPARASRIVIYKFQESVFFSGWGFVILGSPMLLAYGLVTGSPWYYFLLMIPLVVAFVLIPTTLGAIGCLLAIRWLPRLRLHALVVLALGVVLAACIGGWRVFAAESDDLMTPTWFQDVLARLQFSEQRLLPSWWLSSGLLEAAHPASDSAGYPSWCDSLLFLAVLSSHGLLLIAILDTVAARSFRAGYSGLKGIVPARRSAHTVLLDRVLLVACRPLPPIMQQFLLKDFRLFRRDPTQWAQSVIFFGLLLLYFFNVRRFDYGGVMERWVTLISFLNLAVVGLILSTFTTRFIFPLLSMEGRRFWILATAPIDRDWILWGKFCFACAACWPPCAFLVLASDFALRIAERSVLIVIIHQVACAILCLGLAGLAVGLGARLPNLREPSPSKIAAGFGGTLNLIVSALFIVLVVVLTAVPTCLWIEAGWLQETPLRSAWWLTGRWGLGSATGVALGLATTLLLGLVATWLPMRMGLHAFRRLEL